ncbi:GNAT family N-acetyltransferase [Cellulomonas fimi]|uniref:GNAT family N-acetyltransferase n=1 Tax=Cellulomonas fimi TaxID=1708 RepID=A0A7Y0LWU2_CELFI|nr:GNAT family N-acetyltransferase [Cellulomonas fimi]NMR19374.1 GNAT family N-acetyltransferase [Cellulomonas fimi]
MSTSSTQPAAASPLVVRAAAPRTVPTPAPVAGLVWRPLTLADATALTALVGRVEDADEPPYRTSPDEVLEWLEGSWKDLARDTLGAVEPDGTLRAFGFAEVSPGDVSIIRAYLHGGVDPARRGQGIGRGLLHWLDARGRQLLVESGRDAPARLMTFLENDSEAERRLYAAGGFAPRRWYTTMRRDLATPSPQASLASGLRLVPWGEELDDAVRLAHNEAFADHWGSQPRTAEQWRSGRPAFAPGWSFAVLDDDAAEDGRPAVAGYLMSARFEHDWPVRGYTFGYVSQLGVRRPWRGRGVAVALLAAAMDAYRADGLEHAVLDVDTENPTGAHGLYARVGFEPTSGSVMYSIEI